MAYTGTDFPTMDPGESRAISFTFTLTGGETISSVTWGIASVGGVDMFAASHLGSPSVASPVVSNRVTGLQAGVKYIIQAQATTSAGNVYSLYSHVVCSNPV
jgi:hypothetical protein